MKKIFILTMALVAGMTANAQVGFDGAALGLNAETATAVTAGTVLATSDNGIACKAAFDDTYKVVNIDGVGVNGTELNPGTGVQGQSNPKDANGGSPDATLLAPANGAVAQFTIPAGVNGYLYVFHKASSNKAYTVFEEGSPIGYTFSMETAEKGGLPAVLTYTAVGEGEYNIISDAKQLLWPETHQKGLDANDNTNKIGASGVGVIKFPVFEGCNYLVNAVGSKISLLGFYFDTTGDAVITSVKSGATILGGTGAGIQDITVNGAAVDENAPVYNLAGQRVSKDAKGVLIQNGKKVIR